MKSEFCAKYYLDDSVESLELLDMLTGHIRPSGVTIDYSIDPVSFVFYNQIKIPVDSILFAPDSYKAEKLYFILPNGSAAVVDVK